MLVAVVGYIHRPLFEGAHKPQVVAVLVLPLLRMSSCGRTGEKFVLPTVYELFAIGGVAGIVCSWIAPAEEKHLQPLWYRSLFSTASSQPIALSFVQLDTAQRRSVRARGGRFTYSLG